MRKFGAQSWKELQEATGGFLFLWFVVSFLWCSCGVNAGGS